MKRWVLRLRAADHEIFLDIKKGLKSFETRAATERYRKIEKGDILVFICGRRRLTKRVKRVRRFSSIEGMARRVNYKKIMPSVFSVAEMKRVYRRYPGYREKIRKLGIVAFNL